METRPNGDRIALQDGDAIYLASDGASESGDRPFLDRFDLATSKKERLFRCEGVGTSGSSPSWRLAPAGTRPVGVEDRPAEPVRRGPRLRRPAKITDYRDPTPQLTRVTKELVKYSRKDGVPLSGTLYLPPGYTTGTRLPALVWAYPLEYSDPSTAGQVRGSTNTFPRVTGASPLAFLTQGYAVLMDATMPVVATRRR